MTIGYLTPIIPREMPFNLDVLESKTQTTATPKRPSRFKRIWGRK